MTAQGPGSELPTTGSLRPRVLIVEDHAAFRRILRFLLEEGGYSVEEATDGCDALARVSAMDAGMGAGKMDEIPLVVLLDYHLPCLTGEQVLDALTTERTGFRCACACILMSARPDIAAQTSVRYHVPLLAKPFAPDELLRMVARVGLDATQAQREDRRGI